MTAEDYTSIFGTLGVQTGCVTVAEALRQSETVSLVKRESLLYSNLKCVNLRLVVESKCDAFLTEQIATMSVLYVHHGRWTIFDFATETFTWADRYRRLYNAVLAFDRLGYLKLGDTRSSVDYVYVTSQVPTRIRAASARMSSLAVLHQHFKRCDSAPWEYDAESVRLRDERIDHDLRKMSGYLVRMAYYVFPDELDRYANENGWEN